PGLRRILREERRRAGISRRGLLRDTRQAFRSFG
ncbi:MAG: hypothetical protein QOJ74_2070, partial [Ilumatobacteraceae bacterium]|nr:hypothetical protein [Ilumatobacteraceae bacterium]